MRFFQMAVLEPRLAILDETDSGLDIDALKVVFGRCEIATPGARSRHRGRHALPAAAELCIVPDVVHILMDGRIVKSGGKELALELEEKGYGHIEEELAAKA